MVGHDMKNKKYRRTPVCRCSISALEKDFLAGVDGTCAPHLPTLHKLTFVSFPSRIKGQLNDTTTAVSTYTCSCAIVTRARPRDFPNAIGAPARISEPVISGVHGFVLKLTLDALYAGRDDAVSSIKEVDVGHRAGSGSGHAGTDHRKRVAVA